MPPPLHYYGKSDIGLNRSTNQDVWAAQPDYGFFVLADGMGGRKAGDIAAREAVQILSESIRQLWESTNFFQKEVDLLTEIRHAIELANRWVYNMGCAHEALMGMGTTLCCLLWTEQTVYYAHVGDSRIYRFHNDQLELLTEDHSLFARWLSKKNSKTPSPPKNIITRAIGTSKPANPEISSCQHNSEDLYLLCSDGLSDAVSLEELQTILTLAPSLEIATEKMIDYAKIMGGNDNITALIIADKSSDKMKKNKTGPLVIQ